MNNTTEIIILYYLEQRYFVITVLSMIVSVGENQMVNKI